MVRKLGRAARTLLESVRIARQRKIDFMASGVTYYEFFSLVPLVLIGFLTASFLGGEELATRIVVVATGVLPEVGGELVRGIMSSNPGRVSLIGGLMLVWASLRVFRGFDLAFSEIYGEDHQETLIEEVHDALVALIALSTTVFLTVAAGTVIAAFPEIPSIGLLWTFLTFLGVVAVFLPLYYVFTDVDIPVRGLVPGAVVAAAGWTLLQSGFGLYTAWIGGSLYGVFGGILLLVLWMYLGNMLILFGAVVNYVNWSS